MNIIMLFIRVYFSALLFSRNNSLIVIQKVYSNNIYAQALKLLVIIQRKKTVYDLDDAEYIRHDDGTLKFFLKRCAHVTVGSLVLLEYALKLNTNVSINTSPVIDHKYIKRVRNEKITIGWVGDLGNGNPESSQFSHKKSLFDLVFPSLKHIIIPIKLILIGINSAIDKEEISSYFSECKNLELEIPEGINWQDNQWLYAKIKEFDIGLAPLTYHEFNRAKSAFKAKQYLSCGVPVLASRVGENLAFIEDAGNGFFCDTPEDFESKILFLSSMAKGEYDLLSKSAFESRERFTMREYCAGILAIKK